MDRISARYFGSRSTQSTWTALGEVLSRRRDESNKQTRGRENAKKEEDCCPWSGRSGSYSGAAAACWLNRNSAAYNPHYPPDLKFRDNGISQTRRARRRRPSPTQCSDIQADTVLPDMKWIISTRPFSVLEDSRVMSQPSGY